MPRLLFLVMIVLAGCSTLPASLPLDGDRLVEARNSLLQLVEGQRQCRPYLDAAAHLSIKSILFSGAIDGYLQAMAPGRVKFVGVTPLGQPVVVFTTDGKEFRYVEIPAAKSIEGSVASRKYQKYAPAGFDNDFNFYWLIGRLPPGRIKILKLSEDKEGLGVWADLSCGDAATVSRVLFDPQRLIIRRHLLLDPDGEILLDVRYDGFAEDDCLLPDRITLAIGSRNGTIEMNLTDRNREALLTTNDFQFELPPGFSRETAQ